jgi:outer membrane murein-binding lipoprotein Lpp
MMLDLKPVKQHVIQLSILHAALTGAIKGIEGALAASPADPMPAAATMLVDTLATRVSELAGEIKKLEATIKALRQSATSVAAD